uniref:Uncharacterized protein LOC114335964 n=1 Tax=Diabrotica virgifera virgifera TaxID=50390 RepID=A0A6P7GCU9_DIAVI
MLEYLEILDNSQEIDTKEYNNFQDYLLELERVKWENGIGVIHFNIRSLQKHFDELLIYLESDNVSVHCYADDTQVYYTFSPTDLASASEKLNSDLSKLVIESEKHQLKLNPIKSSAMVFELQRRHSEARLGSGSGGGGIGGLSVGGLGSGLAPPRSPELRRHSDVSPASLKELEKLKGTGAKTPDPDWTRNRGGRSAACSRQNSPPREIPAVGPTAPRSRRASRVARQHSYDDEVKNSIAPSANADNGLSLPAPMPRRASAYDVFTVPGLSTVTTAPTGGMTRRASFRIAPPQDPGSPPSPDGPPACLIAPEEDRRTQRRGSRL